MSRNGELRTLGQSILALGRRLGWSGAGSGGTQKGLGRVIRDLETLNRSTERDFLTVGSKLAEFRSSARLIASDMSAVAELISGEQGRDASHALAGMLERSKQIDAEMESSGATLSAVRDLTLRLRRAFSGLTNMVSIFRNLCTLTQIETARLGGAGADLGHLAAEIRPLSESIQTGGESVLQASGRLEEAVRKALRDGAELQATQLKQMPVLIAGVLSGLRSYEERRQVARQTSSRQAAEYAAVSEAVNDLVASIQFHDITRQQVEHVIQALQQLSSHSQKLGKANDAGHRGTILRLQSSQLAEAARLFASSVERMENDLESIARRLESASSAVRELTGASNGEGGGSFFLKMEGEFSAVLKMLSTCANAQTQTETTIAGLRTTVGGMLDSVAAIRGTEIQIQRISTNATIRATHLGVSGAALNKIAEVMQRLSLESNSNTEEASTTLGTMLEAVAGGHQPDGEGLGAEASSTEPEERSQAAAQRHSPDQTQHQIQDPASEEMQGALARLHEATKSSAGRATHIAQLSARLAEDIGALRGGIAAGRLFADVVGGARKELDAMAEQLGQHSQADAAVAAKEHLDHLATTYTMQSQREVHESVVGQASSTAIAEPAPGDQEFGDNIDLF